MEVEPEQCSNSVKCSRANKHPGLCNKKKVQCTLSERCLKNNEHIGCCHENKKIIAFWKTSSIYQKKKNYL